MNWGSIYAVSWFGNSNEANGWGYLYPANADGSYLRADTTLYRADTNTIKADATEF
jgi:hypothetical protein